MLVGILSDSHGRSLLVRKALALFDSLGASYVIHCGDVGGEPVFDELVGRACTFVWGNCDVPTAGLLEYLNSVGLPLPSATPAILSLDGARLAVLHGHEPQFARATSDLHVDYLLHGHTHVRRDERVGGMRVINPGALHRASPKTVATLDLRTDELRFHEIKT